MPEHNAKSQPQKLTRLRTLGFTSSLFFLQHLSVHTQNNYSAMCNLNHFLIKQTALFCQLFHNTHILPDLRPFFSNITVFSDTFWDIYSLKCNLKVYSSRWRHLYISKNKYLCTLFCHFLTQYCEFGATAKVSRVVVVHTDKLL